MFTSTFDPVEILGERFTAAIRAAFPALADQRVDPLIAPSKQPQHGDFQCNAAMPLAKTLGQKPRDVAAAILKHAQSDATLQGLIEPLSDASIAGPGFINVRLNQTALAALVSTLSKPESHLGLAPTGGSTVVVDLMGVNLAKQMHVGHLRSPIIGDAIARTFERLGHRVIRQNHVGDWGLPIAMVVTRLTREAAAGRLKLDQITLDTLDVAYRAAQAECQRDMDGLAAVHKFGLGPKALAELEEQVAGATEAFNAAKQTLVKLQSGDPATKAVWQRVADVTMSVCLAVCKRLHVNVTGEHSAGESSYAEELAPMVADLERRGIAELDQGALIVRLDDQHPPANPYGPIKEPCLIRKTDGGFLYATTDIAAVRRRVQKLGAQRVIYAIDARQSLHMKQVFAASTKAGYAALQNSASKDGAIAELRHAAFGAILGDDGRPFKTRSGENVKLADLLDEMVERAKAPVATNNPSLSPAEQTQIAEAVGIAALKYADLSQDRIKDYVFSFDRMLAFEGNTGPYLLYAYARIRNIFRRAEERGVSTRGFREAPIGLGEPAAKQLALALLRYPAAVRSVAESLEPHRLCTYAYELAGAFSTFYDACHILTEPDEARRLGWLHLCDLTARVLSDALSTLGIPTVDRM